MLRRFAPGILLFLVFAPFAKAADDESIERMRRDLTFLASDECEGRGALTQGIHKAADYIAARFEQLGLRPGGEDGTYFQKFRFRTGRSRLGTVNRLILHGPQGQEIELPVAQQFMPLGMSEEGKVTAPVVFAGYGLNFIDPKEGIHYNDYQGIDVAGKVVIVLRQTPYPGNKIVPFGGQRNQRLGSLTNKLVTADQAKAAAVLFVNDRDKALDTDSLLPFEYTSEEMPPAKPIAAHVRRSAVEMMLQSSVGDTLSSREREIDRTLKPQSAVLTGWTATIELAIERTTVEVKNVIGILEGNGPLARETVILGAHYDHLGRGERGSLERDEKNRQQFHYGADDNGSGTVAMLELARRFATSKGRNGRRIVFMAFAGEEQGLIGSRHFVNKPTFPLSDVAAMVNLDMVGRVRPEKNTKKDHLQIGGTGSAKEFDPLVDALAKKHDFHLSKDPSGYGPSDHTSFTEKKIPVFFLFSGLHEQYHKPTDTVQTINFPGMRKVVHLTGEMLVQLANMPRPTFQDTKPAQPGGQVDVPKIRFMPGNYNSAEERGVLIGGVIKGGPADKAGIKAGDFIVEIGGKPIRNMGGYMTVLATHRAGEKVEFTIERDGKRLKLTVVPE